MSSSPVCGASGTLLLFGGWGGVMWAFLRSLSLHLQICWQVLVGRNFMWFAQVAGWGVPVLDVVLALVFTGVSFRFGATCHINHPNSLADFWIPLLIFACATVIITFATFGYCIKVYLASLADNAASTEGSSVPTYTHSIHTVTPRQAYRRVRRVIALQWRGIAIVLIIIADVIFFSIVFVFQDNIIEQVSKNPQLAESWIICLNEHPDDKNQCLNKVGKFVVNEATVMAVLLLLSVSIPPSCAHPGWHKAPCSGGSQADECTLLQLNGVWLLLLLGRMSMFKGWVELLMSLPSKRKNEFVSVDARLDVKNDPRSYEMLSKGQNSVVTPPDTVRSPDAGRRTPDYFRQAAQYHSPTRSISSPMPHQVSAWDPEATYASPKDTSVETHVRSRGHEDLNPLGMNRV